MLDLFDFLRQLNLWPLEESLGTEAWWPKPASYNGIITSTQDASESRKTLKLVTGWAEGLNHFEQSVLNLDLLSDQTDNFYLHKTQKL